MADNEYVPTLTLNHTEPETPVQAQTAAVAEAPAAPQLTLNEEKQPEVEPERLDIERLSPAEQAAVREFSKQIDPILYSPTAPPRRRTSPSSPGRLWARSAPRTWAR